MFVDASGRRRRLAHRVAVGVFLAAAGYALMVIWSLLGGPVSPDTLMPFSAPRTAGSSVRPSQPSVTADAEARIPRASAGATHSATTTTAAPVHATSPAPAASPSAGARASASASSPGRRPTAPPGKSSPTATGHGH